MGPLGLDLLSPSGIQPRFVQVVDPDLYAANEEHERSLESGGKHVATPYPPDPNYPAHAQSDPLAWTPMYRGHQNWMFSQTLDQHNYHGPGSESLNYAGYSRQWYDWDGTVMPPWSPSNWTATQKSDYRKAWFDFVFPAKSDGNFCIRGLKQLYDDNLPFADPYNPTPREFERWNDKVLNHFRSMSGLQSAVPQQELFILCAFSAERKNLTLWDAEYPGTFDSAYGPCVGGSNLHCGSTFKPSDVDDQAPYWNDYFMDTTKPKHPLITITPLTEVMFTWYNGTAMTAMSRTLRKLMEGASNGSVISGHGGPWLGGKFYGHRDARSKWYGPSQVVPDGYSW